MTEALRRKATLLAAANALEWLADLTATTGGKDVASDYAIASHEAREIAADIRSFVRPGARFTLPVAPIFWR